MNAKEFLNATFAEDKTVDIEIGGVKYSITFKGEISSDDLELAANIGRMFCFEDGKYDCTKWRMAQMYCLIKVFTDIEIDGNDDESVSGFIKLVNNYDFYKIVRDNVDKAMFCNVLDVFNDSLDDERKKINSIYGIIDEIKGLNFKEMFGEDFVNSISKLSELDEDNIVKSILEYYKEEGTQNKD